MYRTHGVCVPTDRPFSRYAMLRSISPFVILAALAGCTTGSLISGATTGSIHSAARSSSLHALDVGPPGGLCPRSGLFEHDRPRFGSTVQA